MEQALRELDNQQEELRKIKEEQDELAAKTAEVLLDALASLDFKLSVTEWVSEWVIDIFFTASASSGLSDLFFCGTDKSKVM